MCMRKKEREALPCGVKTIEEDLLLLGRSQAQSKQKLANISSPRPGASNRPL